MDVEALRGVREGPIGGRIVVVALVSVVAVLMIVVLALAVAPPRPPGSLLTGTTWQWTGATTGSADVLVVPDPAKYTVEFKPDWTFRATADCNTVSGTYRTVSAGRTGLPSIGLRLWPDPHNLASCGPDSLSDAFLQGLWSAARYEIADSQLTILRSTEGTMIFEVGGSEAIAPGGT